MHYELKLVRTMQIFARRERPDPGAQLSGVPPLRADPLEKM